MSNVSISRPEPGEYAPPFGKYIALVPDGDILSILAAQLTEAHELLDGVSDRDSLVHHAPYTWSLREVVGHITDGERVFGYRALRLARNDATPLSGFDENAWMAQANFDRWPLKELLADFDAVRRAHLRLFERFEPDAWIRRGVVLNHPSTARAFAFAIAGHAKHHMDIMRRRLTKT